MPFSKLSFAYMRADHHVDLDAYMTDQTHRIEVWSELEELGYKIDWKALAQAYHELEQQIQVKINAKM